MRKIRWVKVVVPEIVAYYGYGLETTMPDYRCTECGCGVSTNYVCCPYCSVELDWEKVRKPSKAFKKFMDKL